MDKTFFNFERIKRVVLIGWKRDFTLQNQNKSKWKYQIVDCSNWANRWLEMRIGPKIVQQVVIWWMKDFWEEQKSQVVMIGESDLNQQTMAGGLVRRMCRIKKLRSKLKSIEREREITFKLLTTILFHLFSDWYRIGIRTACCGQTEWDVLVESGKGYIWSVDHFENAIWIRKRLFESNVKKIK